MVLNNRIGLRFFSDPVVIEILLIGKPLCLIMKKHDGHANQVAKGEEHKQLGGIVHIKPLLFIRHVL